MQKDTFGPKFGSNQSRDERDLEWTEKRQIDRKI